MTRNPDFWRYTAFQVPGWIIAAACGWWTHRWLDVPTWLAAGMVVAWVIKDYALYPLLRSAYEQNHKLPIERMIGERGKAAADLAPTGYVRVRAELWRAKATDEHQKIDKGDAVIVTGLDGTTLVVKSCQ